MKNRRGRPRDESVDSKVIESALGILNEEGMSGLTVDGITAKAGVSKASFYRRWDSKDELIVDLIASLVEVIEIPETGDIRRDLTTVVSGMRKFVSDTRAGEVFPWLVGEMARQSPIGIRYMTIVVAPRKAKIARLISNAVDKGDLRPDLDVDTAVDMIMSPIIVRRLTGSLDKTPRSWAEHLVGSLLDGWRS